MSVRTVGSSRASVDERLCARVRLHWQESLLADEIVPVSGQPVSPVLRDLLQTDGHFRLGSEGQQLVVQTSAERPYAFVAEPLRVEEEGVTRSIVLPLGSSLELTFGEQRLSIDANVFERTVIARAPIDPAPAGYVGAVSVFFGLFLGATYLMPPSASGLSLDVIDSHSRLVALMTETEARLPEQLPAAGAQGAAGPEGASGAIDAPVTRQRAARSGSSVRRAERALTQQNVVRAGVLGTLRQVTWGDPSSPFGADSSIGEDGMETLGALLGDTLGTSGGPGGLGLRGAGLRAGTCSNPNEPCFAVGIDQGEALRSSGFGQRRQPPALRSRCEEPGGCGIPRMLSPCTEGSCETLGSLSRETIQRVVARHRNEMRACYEQALMTQPDLQGRVTVQFMISGEGRVMYPAVSSSDLRHGETESCVLRVVGRMAFPQPEDGGMVTVRAYPFVFSSSN